MALLRQAFIFLVIAVIVSYYIKLGPFKHGSGEDESIDDEYDYIIVGGGTAGSVLAARLAEDKDQQVLLVEAGGHFEESPLSSIPFLSFGLQHSKHDWAYYTTPQECSHFGFNERRGFWPLGRILGGTSIINFMQYTRGSKYDFDDWALNGCPEWSYKHVLPYFLKSEDVMIESLKSSDYHSMGGPMAVSNEGVTHLDELFMLAHQDLGHAVTDYNGDNQIGVGRAQVNIRNGVRSSPAIEFLVKNTERKNLHIALNTFVSKVEIKEKTATGVSVIRNGRKIFIKARKEIILSAGAINTPQILMLSGIGPKEQLNEVGIKLVKDLPVGKNLQDKMAILMFTKINSSISITMDIAGSFWTKLKYILLGKGVLATTGTAAQGFFYIDETNKENTSPDIQMEFLRMLIPFNAFNYKDEISTEYFAGNADVHGFTIILFNSHPKSRGVIKLRSSDPFESPDIDPRYLSDSSDVRLLLAGVRMWERFIETPTMQSLNASVDQMKLTFCSQHQFRSDEYWECYIRHVAVTSYQPCCTVKMGAESDPTSVVDPQLRVKGIKGLRVADASIFPNTTSGFAAAPVVMVAEKLADIIRDTDSVKQFRK